MNRDDDTRILKSDSFGRILLVRDGERRFVRRDLGATPWWLRLPAWWLARREARALRRLDGMAATPRLLGWDGRWLDRSYMEGAAMHQRPPRGDVAWFRAARRLGQLRSQLRNRKATEADAFVRIQQGRLRHQPRDAAHALVHLRQRHLAELRVSVLCNEILDFLRLLIRNHLEPVFYVAHNKLFVKTKGVMM